MPIIELISSDSHVNVAHDAIKARIASKHHAEYDAAVDRFMQRMIAGTGAANGAWATDRQRHAAPDPQRFKHHTRPGYSDGAARLADMDLDDVRTEVIYSELSFFRYWGYLDAAQHDTLLAFNDVLHDFAAPDPSRLVVSYQIPIQDITAAMAEIERVADLGAKSLQLPVAPPELGFPDYYHERYDPLFALIQETGLPICCHIGLNTSLDDLVARDPTPDDALQTPMAMLSTAEPLGMWILGGVFERFPDLKLVFVEPGVGWIPWWLQLVDDMVVRQGYDVPEITELPSFYFHRNVFITFIDEAEALGFEPFRYRLGVENIMWSTDYPHPISSFPNSQQVAHDCVANLPPHEQELILSGNAKRVWNL
jgi:predicted TIM-barrel fold metal-dependent hydrolase